MTRTRHCILVLAVFLLSGCLGGTTAPVATTYYNLEYPPPRSAPLAAADTVLRLEGLGYPLDPAGRDMLYRSGPFIRDAYRYHRWHAPPTDMVHGLLLRDLRETGLFRAVLSPDEAGAPRYVLSGQVEEFLQREDQGSSLATLVISMTLVDISGKGKIDRISLQKTYRLAEPLGSRQPAELAKGMSAAMARFSRELAGDIDVAINGSWSPPK
jgi:ABC-type uncharacterized transport system auxiliary subunit